MSKQRETIHIVIATDNHYAILLAPLIRSVQNNHKTSEQIAFAIIDNGISRINLQKLRSMVDGDDYTLTFHDMQSVLPEGIHLPLDGTGMPQITYMRMFAPFIVGSSAKRVIYLDVDMIVNRDISELWSVELDGRTVGCVQDHSATVSCEWAGIPNYRELGLDPETKYFNAGLLVIDIEKWKKENIPQKILTCVEENKDSLLLADQYALNVVFANSWKELDHRWNCKAGVDVKDPFIMHFIDIKPIYSSYNGSQFYKSEFFRYLKMTPWADFKIVPNYVRIFRKGFYKVKKTVKKIFALK